MREKPSSSSLHINQPSVVLLLRAMKFVAAFPLALMAKEVNGRKSLVVIGGILDEASRNVIQTF